MKSSSQFPGVAYPNDLTLLQRVFDPLCDEHHIPRDGFEAEHLGKAAMSLLTSGVLDEAQLMSSLQDYLKRRSRL